jgi:hypothetical protein
VNILRALKKEEAKFLKQLDSTRQQLETVRAAMKVLGGKATGKKKRFVSKVARARWRRRKGRVGEKLEGRLGSMGAAQSVALVDRSRRPR